MPNDGKPEVPNQPTDVAGTTTQPDQGTPANPTVEVSDGVKNYLKGLGLEGVQATPELVKVAEAGMKQKESVSKMSFEVEGLRARLASQGKDDTLPEPPADQQPQAPQATTSTPVQPTPQAAQPTQTGVSDNDLFDLVMMIQNNFPELKDSAQDGSLFGELRSMGYFSAQGYSKKDTFDYLSAKNAQLAELRELREFKQQHSQPDPSNMPLYNPTPGAGLKDGEMNAEAAHAIVMSGDQNNPRYADAINFLRQSAISNNTVQRKS